METEDSFATLAEQGNILFMDIGPTRGHEENGRRPVIVVSIEDFYKLNGLVKVVPITNSPNPFGTTLPMPASCKTTGTVLCQHESSLDISQRNPDFIEVCPKDTLKQILNVLDMSIHE